MKILHILSDTVLGGAQKVCIDLANSACTDGNEVAVAAMKDGYLWDQLNPQVKQFQLKNMEKKINKKDFLVLAELRKIRKEYKPDIIHVHTAKPGILGRWAFRKDRKHIVYTMHGFDNIKVVHKKFLFIEKFFQKYTGATVAVSKYDEKNMEECKVNKNLLTIYNGIGAKAIDKKNAFPVDIKESKIVLSIARIAPQKKLDMFVSVARQFENKDVAFIWIGGSSDKSIDEISAEYNIPSNVYLLGDVQNASSYINLCDIFVLFTNYEGLPMSIIEAMSQEKAVVASDVGGIYELVDDTNGKLILTEEDAVKSINDLLNDKEKLSEKDRNSLNKFNSNFTLEKMWKEYLKLYNELLSQ